MWIKILLLFFVFSFLFKTDQSFNQDLGRHIKLGEIIVNGGAVPKTNLFSYTNPDFPFINTHWLFEVLLYFSNQTVGLLPLLFLKIVIFLVSILLIIKIIPKEKTALLLPVGFIFFHVLRERTDLRPEIFSFLLTASTYYILEKFTKTNQMSSDRGTFVSNSKLIFLLPLIQLIWINTHIYFFVGLVLQAVFLIHVTYQNLRSHSSSLSLRAHPSESNDLRSGKVKLLSMVFFLSVMVSLINPNGLTGLIYPLNVTKNYGYTIVENQTMFLLESINFKDPNFLFVKLSIGLVILSLVLALLTRKFEIKNIILAIFGVFLAILNVRGFPYLLLISFPAVLANFPSFQFRGFIKALTILVAPLLLLESYFYLNGDYYRFNDQLVRPNLEFAESTKGALDFTISKDLPKPLFNNFDIGSYIIYRTHPKYRVFVDGRPEAYPAAFFQQIYIPSQSDYPKFKELESQYGFKTIIFSHTDQTPWGRNFLQNLVKDESWKLVYIDGFMLVLVKKGADIENLATVDLSRLDPTTFRFDSHVPYLRIGLFLLSTGYTDSGSQFIQKTLQIFPDSPTGNTIIGNPEKSKTKFFW